MTGTRFRQAASGLVRVLMPVLFVFLFHSCASAPEQRMQEAPRQIPKPAVNAAGLEKKIHILINRERKSQGLPQLAWNDRLADIARKHSQDMNKRKYFDHISPEGRDFLYRYGRDSYKCSVSVAGKIYLGAENIALNHLYSSVTTVNGQPFYDWNNEDKIAETTVQGWMNSAGHRKNILTPHWNNEGIGIVIAPDDKIYITQNFC